MAVKTIFFMVDTSRSMIGVMDGVNRTIKDSIPDLCEIQKKMPNVQIKIAVLGFSKEAEWFLLPTPVCEFKNHWRKDLEIVDAIGANYGIAYNELYKILTDRRFNSMSDFILIVAVSPNGDSSAALECLKNEAQFAHGFKTAIPIGEGTDPSVIKEFVGDNGTVTNPISDINGFELIREAAIAAAQR